MQKWQLDKYFALLKEGNQHTKFSFIGTDNHCWTFKIHEPVPKEIINVMPTNFRIYFEKENFKDN